MLLCCDRSSLTLCDPMECSLPGSSVLGIFQVRVLEWVAISSSRGSSQSRDWTCISCIADRFFTTEALGKPLKIMLSLNFLRSLETCSISLAIFLLLWILKKLSLCNLWNEDTWPRPVKTHGQEEEPGRTVQPQTVAQLKSGADPGCSAPLAHRPHFLLPGCVSVTSSSLSSPALWAHRWPIFGVRVQQKCLQGSTHFTSLKRPLVHRHTWVWVLSLFISWVVSMLILPVLSPEFHHSAWSHIHSWTIMYWAPSVGPGPAHRAEHITASKMGKVPALIGFALPAGRETLSTFLSI